MPKVKPTPTRDITGQSFGTLTGLRQTLRKENGFAVWKVRCQCGKTIRVSWKALHDKKITSCGTGCWPSKQLERNIENIHMWDRINQKKYAQKCQENRIKWAKEKEARQKRQEEEEKMPTVDDFNDWGDF